ncbi:tetratricopeptide repeat protein [Leptospira noguchii str. 1993005606]|uniref:Tetratricopeptide repeat protein n=2 Tax=Leptospira noguchii TaxID=28182 RepID=M6VIK3_9LEPT|nr:tetratricopeptide repeat protein [Leptospira noguchii]EMN02291.1 tetratricopeptide repeat protein [Leptospira noguchii str. 2007001578]EMO54876.1 tetratricopeptide repeat protein [Leptospira noguchii]EPE81709.1 tetratricopeptide repeat protein [Leptospira noguchii str. 1993005606]
MKRYEIGQTAKEVKVDPYADFQGSKMELAFAKFFRAISFRIKEVLIGVGAILVIVLAVVIYVQYQDSQFEKGTIALEILEKKFRANPATDLKEKIKAYEEISAQYSSKKLELRLAKTLSDLYSRNGEFQKAADKLEWAGKKIEEPTEVKAYYFYLAGNLREREGNLALAETDFSVSANLLANTREANGFLAWSLYQTGRLQVKNGKKAEATESLKKVLDQEIKTPATDYNTVKQYATFLLIQLNQKG